jgi:hypothetical protein
MQPLKAHVHNGRLVLDEPTDLPEGEVVYLQPVDTVVPVDGDELDEEERAASHRELEASIAEAEATDRGLRDSNRGAAAPAVKLEISKRARRQIERIQAWWVTHRRDARGLFLEELAARATTANDAGAGLDLQRRRLGSIYTERKTGTVRRVLLPRTHHHLYYRYRADRDELTVLCVWGGPKERGRKL